MHQLVGLVQGSEGRRAEKVAVAPQPEDGDAGAAATAKDRKHLVNAAMAIAVVSGTPMFLLMAIAPELRHDLGISVAQLGILIAVFHVAGGSFAALAAGPATQRLGEQRSVALVLLVTIIVFLGLAGLARSWLHVAVLLAAAGASQALANVVANVIMIRHVRLHRQALVFSVKQSAMPSASMVAGLVAPLAVLTIGWRWTAFILGVLVVILWWSIGRLPGAAARRASGHPSPRLPPGRRRALIVLATGAAFASAAAVAMTTFLVETAVHRGMSLSPAGLVLSASSLAAIIGRVSSGWLADRRGRAHLFWITGMLWFGAVGFVVVALTQPGPAFVVGAVAAGGLAWGWNGLFYFAMVHYNREAPALSTGLASAGVYLGGGLGPLSFGLLAEWAGYGVAWCAGAGALALAGVLLLTGRHMLGRSLRAHAP